MLFIDRAWWWEFLIDKKIYVMEIILLLNISFKVGLVSTSIFYLFTGCVYVFILIFYRWPARINIFWNKLYLWAKILNFVKCWKVIIYHVQSRAFLSVFNFLLQVFCVYINCKQIKKTCGHLNYKSQIHDSFLLSSLVHVTF